MPNERDAERVNHVRRLLTRASLQAARGTPGYDEQLLAFYATLDPGQDTYFIEALKGEFDAHREKALARAQQAFEDARASWQKYRDKGGIQGLQRLEAGISPTFRNLANTLSEAYRDASYGSRLYRLLNAGYPDDWDALDREIAKEVDLQRRSLSELSMVLEPSLKQAKLKLLPDLPVDQLSGEPEGAQPGASKSGQ